MSVTDGVPNFSGKVVSFSTAESVLAMQDIRFEEQGGRLFVCGVIPEGVTPNEWAMNRPSAIAWDCVTDYIVFDSVTQYVEQLAKSEIE